MYELLFEHFSEALTIVYSSKSQIIDDFSKLIGTDPRYTAFSTPLAKLRDNWIFTYHTFSQSTTFCVVSPIVMCYDKLAKNVLSSFSDGFDDNVDENEDSTLLIIFVIASKNTYLCFEREFQRFSHSKSNSPYSSIYLNGRCRNLLLVKITQSDIAWAEILVKYANYKFSFVGLYSDAATYSFVEATLARLNAYFQKITKYKPFGSGDFSRPIEKVSESLTTAGGMFNMSNIVVIFCLEPFWPGLTTLLFSKNLCLVV